MPCVAAYRFRAEGTIVSPATSTFGIPGAASVHEVAPDASRSAP